jgi:hypothetical protein
VCNKEQSEVDMFGQKAAEFIFKYKSPKVQVSKIIEMLSKLKYNV